MRTGLWEFIEDVAEGKRDALVKCGANKSERREPLRQSNSGADSIEIGAIFGVRICLGAVTTRVFAAERGTVGSRCRLAYGFNLRLDMSQCCFEGGAAACI